MVGTSVDAYPPWQAQRSRHLEMAVYDPPARKGVCRHAGGMPPQKRLPVGLGVLHLRVQTRVHEQHGPRCLHQLKPLKEFEVPAEGLLEVVADLQEMCILRGDVRWPYPIAGKGLSSPVVQPGTAPDRVCKKLGHGGLVIALEECHILRSALRQRQKKLEHLGALVTAIDVVAEEHELYLPTIGSRAGITLDLPQQFDQKVVTAMNISDGIDALVRSHAGRFGTRVIPCALLPWIPV